MPLPSALLKRLAKRGLVNNSTSKTQNNTSYENEEIIAEDYDDVEDPLQYDYEPVKKPKENFWIERMKHRLVDGNFAGYKNCPNKYNIYHKCTVFCINRWPNSVMEPNRSYLNRRNRLLKKYPLPITWEEVYDFACGVYYYWNTSDDTVSWLPPLHPKSNVSKSASTLRRELEEALPPLMDEEDDNGAEVMSLAIQKILENPSLPIPKRPGSPAAELAISSTTFKKQKSRDLEKSSRLKKVKKGRNSLKGRQESDDLDPMDPAAYSDIPRGKWSDGLNAISKKSGVDQTATGSLFQMRPYPNPGAVLRANANNEQ